MSSVISRGELIPVNPPTIEEWDPGEFVFTLTTDGVRDRGAAVDHLSEFFDTTVVPDGRLAALDSLPQSEDGEDSESESPSSIKTRSRPLQQGM